MASGIDEKAVALQLEVARLTRELEIATGELATLPTRALQAERMLAVGTLAASIAHEVNNPLTYVLSNLHTALDTFERAELKRDQISAFGRDWRIARCEGSMSAIIEPAPS